MQMSLLSLSSSPLAFKCPSSSSSLLKLLYSNTDQIKRIMSCNGCRVLRKGCSPDCVIRPCLEWIKSPESQANATIFLAKFYGRVGLINLINTGPNHLRPGSSR